MKKIFTGLTFYINGRQHIQDIELRQLILQRGGYVETYHTYKVTHMVARELSESKAEKLRKQSLKKKFPVLVVRSEWITDSITAGKLLEERLYIPKCVDETSRDQQKISRYVNTVNANVNEKNQQHNKKVSPLISTTTTKDSIVSGGSSIQKLQKTSETDLNFVSNFFANSRLHHIGRY